MGQVCHDTGSYAFHKYSLIHTCTHYPHMRVHTHTHRFVSALGSGTFCLAGMDSHKLRASSSLTHHHERLSYHLSQKV